MIAVLTTLAFLAAAWLAVVALAQTLDENAGSIAAALRGQSLLAGPQSITVSLRSRPTSTHGRSARPQPALRVAA